MAPAPAPGATAGPGSADQLRLGSSMGAAGQARPESRSATAKLIDSVASQPRKPSASEASEQGLVVSQFWRGSRLHAPGMFQVPSGVRCVQPGCLSLEGEPVLLAQLKEKIKPPESVPETQRTPARLDQTAALDMRTYTSCQISRSALDISPRYVFE